MFWGVDKREPSLHLDSTSNSCIARTVPEEGCTKCVFAKCFQETNTINVLSIIMKL